jgi:hypothetical protein
VLRAQAKKTLGVWVIPHIKEQSLDVAILPVTGRERIMNGATVIPSVRPEAYCPHYLDNVENIVTAALHVVLQFIRYGFVVIRLVSVSSEGSKPIITVLLLEVKNFGQRS